MQKILRLMLLCLLACAITLAACDDDDDDTETDDDAVDDDFDDDAVDDDDDAIDDDVADDDFVYPFCEIDESAIDLLISQMTLRQKIAQMYVLPAQVLPWFEIGDARRFVEEIGAGGVFIQPGTTIGFWPEWTVESINKIQTWALSGDFPIPALVVCDQEGGIPQAINAITGGTDTPGNLGLGATFDPDAAYQSYRIMGEQISALGINNAYAPVAGLMLSPEESSMYTRCFGEDTDQAAAMVRQAVRGFQENLVIATVKHFPSHSTASGDEHWGAVYNEESAEAVRNKYFPPFQAAVDAGVDMVMTTHATYEAWGDVPVTFNRELLIDVLRGEMGFSGLIVTDDMNMGSITNMPWTEHPHVSAVVAGVDMVLDVGGDDEMMFGMHPDNEQWAIDVEGQIDAIESAVQSGRIDAAQIDASVRRILRAKMKYCLFENPYRNPTQAEARLQTPAQELQARELHEAAITLVRNDAGLWPIDPETGLKIHVVCISPYQSQMYPDAFWGNLATSTLYREMRKLAPNVSGDFFDVEPGAFTRNRLISNATAAAPDLLVIGSYHGNYHEGQKALINGLLELNIPTILVALAMPYDLLAFPNVSTYFATYSNRDMAVETAARILFGLAQPGGRLPVSLPGMYDAGWSANK